MPQMDFFDRIQSITEKYLTHRAKIRRLKKEKRKKKNPVLDWIEAFLWAACMVLLLNQYLVQAYRIPSGSMIDSLNIGDHVFVNKIIFGPELLPGFFKLPSPFKPKQNDIIIFQNPSYVSRGTGFDIAQRIIYMLTLTLVDIDKDDSGDPRINFLIKRAVGKQGDRIVFENGEMKILFAGETRWVDEREYNIQREWNHNITRNIRQDQYPAIIAANKKVGWEIRGMQVSNNLFNDALQASSIVYSDGVTNELVRRETLRKAVPTDDRYVSNYARQKIGWYIPEGRVFPLGDARDNSRDGRSFGPINSSRVLGKGLVIYWPLGRMGKIK